MNYLTERSLFYYFLLCETVADATVNYWRVVAERFCVDKNDVTEIEPILHNEWLNDLASVEDIELYKNFLRSNFSKDIESLFGIADIEREIVDVKKSALLCAYNFFGEEPMYNRVHKLANRYTNDPIASVLYALILERNRANNEFADSVLQDVLSQGNCDAGLLLLNSARVTEKNRIISDLSTTAEMAIHPEVLQTVATTYGCSGVEVKFKSKQPIGFGRISK